MFPIPPTASRCLGGIVLIVVALPAGAAPGLKATLDAAFERASRMPLVQALRNESAAVREQASSLVARDPSLSLFNLNDRLNADRGYAEWEAGVELPLWLPGQRGARLRLADAMDAQATALRDFLRLEVAGQVREAAWDNALAAARLRLAAAALESARGLENDVRRRTRAGESSRADLLLARQETLAAEAELQSARSDHDQALSRLRLLSGLEQAPESIEESPAAGERIRDDHPRLRLADLLSRRAARERDRVLTERRDNPTLSIGAKRQRGSRDQNWENLLALELRVPLGLSSQSAPRRAQAERELTDKQVERHRVQLELKRDLAGARLALVASRDAVVIAGRRREAAREALRLARRAYELGESGLLPLVQARQRAVAADLGLELRRLEQGRAVARVNQALGVVPGASL